MPSRIPSLAQDDENPPLPACRFAREGVAVGDVLGGKYRIDAPIAEGGMGIVLRATHLELDCPVALKVIRPEHLSNEEVVARFLSEARIAANLRSKHVNHVLDVGRTACGVPYLVLEYMAGSDLGSYLAQRGRLPVSEAVDYVLQACEALAEAHAIGIVHRDLKPENLFLSEEADGGFVLKVLDFGISKAPARRGNRSVITNPFEIIGSPTYMSPEQIRGLEVDARADIWALGASLHELCTGKILFAASSMTETFQRILEDDYLPSSYGTGSAAALLHQVICRCLRRNPDERYRDVVELARQLAPLGTDGLQAARVAKVAMAARARVISATADEDQEIAVTPLAITRSELEILPVLNAPRRLGRWMLVAAAASLSMVGGLGYLTRAEGRPRPEAASLLPTPSPAAAPSPPPASEGAAPSPALDAPPPPPVIEPVRLQRPPVRQRPRELRTMPAPVRVEAAPTTSVAAPQPQQGFADAWDPKTFGGRR